MAALGLAALLLTGCSSGVPFDTLQSSHRPVNLELRVPKNMDDQSRAILLNTVEHTVDQSMQRLLLAGEKSEITAVNRIGHTVRMPISRETSNLLLLCRDFNQRSGGAYDITTTPLACLWGFHGAPTPSREVSDDLLRATRQTLGFNNLRLSKNTIELLTPHIRLNLDRIAPAYTVDLAIIRNRRLNYGSHLLALGPNVRALGRPSRTAAWRYPLPNPFKSGAELAQVRLDKQPALSIAQNGDDYVMIDGIRYGNIIDPRSGRPARGTALVAVLAPTATRAHALAEAFFILGPKEGMTIMPEFAECEVLVIPDETPPYARATRGMLDALEWPEEPAMPCTLLQ